MVRPLLSLVPLAALTFSLGCENLYEAHRVNNQADAGSTHIAVISVTRWDQAVTGIQPQFTLSTDNAFKESIPNTLATQQQVLSAVAAQLKVALPQTGTSTTTNTQSATAQQPASTSTQSTTTSTPGDVSKIPDAQSPVGSRTASGLPGGSTASATTTIDPMLQYWAATALYEEVQLINRYLKDAALDDAYSPYIVRLQVSIMPLHRDQPYDVYDNVSFFMGPLSSVPAPLMQLAASPTAISTSRRIALLDIPGAQETAAGTNVATAAANPPSTPRIIPLLVTDDIEAALASRSLEQMQQLALALSGEMSGIGVSGDFQKTLDKLQAVSGHDLNSTFTVARDSDNTVRLRFGAMYQATSHYAMIPQTHNVTLLVLAPKSIAQTGDRHMHLVSRTSLVDTDSGKVLHAQSQTDFYVDSVFPILTKYKLVDAESFFKRNPVETQLDLASTLMGFVDANDFDGFVEFLGSSPSGATRSSMLQAQATKNVSQKSPRAAQAHARTQLRYVEALWSDLAALRQSGEFAVTSWQLPHPPSPNILPQQTPVLVDDGKAATTVVIAGGNDLDAEHMRGELSVTNDKGTFTFPATNIQVTNGGQTISLTFPSLANIGLAKDGKLLSPDKPAAVQVFFPQPQLGKNDPQPLLQKDGKPSAADCAYLVQTTPPKAPFSMVCTAGNIDADAKGTGTVTLLFDGIPKNKTLKLSIQGATIDDKSLPNDVMLSGTSYAVKDDVKSAPLSLSNLAPNKSVVIEATDPDSKTSITITLTVTSLQPAKTTTNGQ